MTSMSLEKSIPNVYELSHLPSSHDDVQKYFMDGPQQTVVLCALPTTTFVMRVFHANVLILD